MSRPLSFEHMDEETGITDDDLAKFNAACVSDPFAAETEYGKASRARPIKFSRDDMEFFSRGGYVALPRAYAWPVRDRTEALAVRADLTRLAGNDDEWLPFGQDGIDALEGRHKDDVCVAVGIAEGVAQGYFILGRQAQLGGSASEPWVWYTINLERAYLVPDARGSGLASVFNAFANDMFDFDMESLNKALSVMDVEGSVTVNVYGEGESVQGAKLLMAIAESLEGSQEYLEETLGSLGFGEMSIDLDTVIIDLEEGAAKP